MGGYTGAVINLSSIFTSGVYWYRIKKNKSNVPFQILFGISFVILALLSLDGPIRLFVAAVKRSLLLRWASKTPEPFAF